MREIPNTLFSKPTIERFCSDVKLKPKQKSAAKKWKELLDGGKLKVETQNETAFVNLILNDLLEYPKPWDGLQEKVDYMDFSFPPSPDKGIVIELKGRGKDLFKNQHYDDPKKREPISQTFNYILSNPGYEYGICTNYEEFVLITRRDGYAKCYRFKFPEKNQKLTEEKIKEFVGIFSKNRIVDQGFVETLTYESIIEQEDLTGDFYKLFHETRLMLMRSFEDKKNISRPNAIKYAQMFLNRLIFIFFSEDNDLTISGLFTKQMVKILEMDGIKEGTTKICDHIQTIFTWMDKGTAEIDNKIGFDGELFKDILDRNAFFYDVRKPEFYKKITEKTKFRKKPTLNPELKKIVEQHKGLNPIITNLLLMDGYNFKSQITVDILGQIFEQSIGDLEELRSEEITQKKKEGVFYTPEVITEYLASNTIIPYLSNEGNKDAHALVLEYSKNLEELEKKFTEIKILDPACGSGAFLVKAADVLLDISKEIQEFKDKRGTYSTAGQYTLEKDFEDVKLRGIIQNNIYGVDINPESIEITKLSLFIKIATKNKRLFSLSERIKVGNSLVSDSTIDDKAFQWDERFPEVMSFGKFNIIIGNPPYVSQKGTTENPNIEYDDREYYRKTYATLSEQELKTRGGIKLNLFALWIERAIELLGENGVLGFIVHKNLLKVESYKFLRKFILEKMTIREICDLGAGIFKDVVGETVILNLLKQKSEENKIIVKEGIEQIKNQTRGNIVSQDIFNETLDNMFNIYLDKPFLRLKKKLWKDAIPLETCYDVISFGLNTKDNKKYFMPTRKDSSWKKAVMGRNVAKWVVKSPGYVYYNEKVLTRIGDVDAFDSDEKLILQRIGTGLIASYDDEKLYCYNSTNMILKKDPDFRMKYLLCLLNSKLIDYYYIILFSMKAKLTVNITQGYLSQIPIKKISDEKQKRFKQKADSVIDYNKEFLQNKMKFLNRVSSKFNVTKHNKKLDSFYDVTFDEFIKEIKKKYDATLSLKEQDEWQDYFEDHKQKLLDVNEKIVKTENEIDEMVYALYDISEEEQKVIEGLSLSNPTKTND